MKNFVRFDQIDRVHASGMKMEENICNLILTKLWSIRSNWGIFHVLQEEFYYFGIYSTLYKI
jgi:hypothetical protein